MTSDDCRRDCQRKVDAMHDALLGTLAGGPGFIHRTDERLAALEAPRLRRAQWFASVASSATGWAVPTLLAALLTAAAAWATGVFQ